MKLIIGNIHEFNVHEHRKVQSGVNFINPTSISASTDMALFWAGNNKTVITPYKLQDSFINDIKDILKYKNLVTLHTSSQSGMVSQDAMEDSLILRFLQKTFSENVAEIIMWGITPEFYQFKSFCDGLGLRLDFSHVTQKENSWTIEHFGSKVGARQVFIELGTKTSLKIPDGYICANIGSVQGIINYFWNSRKSLIIKSNTGSGGKGITMIRDSEPYNKVQQFVQTISSDFQNFPLIIEEYLVNSKNVGIDSPTYNGFISKDGKIQTKSVGIQIIKDGQFYSGGICGRGVIETDLYKTLSRFGTLIGELLHQFGYLGWYNVDFLYSDDKDIYGCEINMRRSGSSTMIDVAEHLFGHDWRHHKVFLMREKYRLPDSIVDYNRLSKLVIDTNNNNLPFIPVVVSSINKNRTIGMLTYGNSVTEAKSNMYEIEKKLQQTK